MPIKKRKSLPKDEAVEASTFEEDGSTARHPHLQGLRQDVYQFVKANSHCTRDDVARGLGMKSSTATARIKELIDEGFLIEPMGVRKENASGVRAKVLAVTARPQGGSPLDKVRIEINLAIDHNGQYHASAHVVSGASTIAGQKHTIKRQRITLTAPHPDTYKGATAAETVARLNRMELQAHADDIIDGEFTYASD